MKLFAIAVGTVLAACAADAEPASSCPDIVGNYSTVSNRTATTCDPSLGATPNGTAAFSKSADGYVMVLPGLPGGCPGNLDSKTCHFTANCEVKAASGETSITFSIDYAFTPGKFTGSSIGGARPPLVPKSCQVTYQDTGTKL